MESTAIYVRALPSAPSPTEARAACLCLHMFLLKHLQITCTIITCFIPKIFSLCFLRMTIVFNAED